MGSEIRLEDAQRIAITGMAARLPGAPDLQAFWRLIDAEREGIQHLAADALRDQGVPPEHLASPDYVKACPVINDIDKFDADFFGIPGIEATLMDPQHRLFLQLAWHAFEDAACDSTRFDGRIGVFAGCGPSTYMAVCGATRDALTSRRQFLAMIGNDKDFIPTRTSYLLGLTGPSVNINTACSSSLVAVHYACQSLLEGECDIALAGGISLRVPAVEGYFHSDGGVHSPDGHCRAFDAAAAGTVDGAGAGLVVLQRLEDARSDNHPVRAVIAGSAVNNDGRDKVGYTSPSVGGQRAVIAEALSVAGITPDDIDYIEAHGTGTPLGDPIEVEALAQAFHARRSGMGKIGIGSVKTNIGHAGAAAGVAGLIKTVLCLEHERIAPQLHYRAANPKLRLSETPFEVVDAPEPWPRSDRVRRAGVSSFGIGGTNAHVILEEAPGAPERTAPPSGPDLLLLSARSAQALDDLKAQTADLLVAADDSACADLAATLSLGRRQLPHRVAVAFQDVAAAREGMQASIESAGARSDALENPPIYFLFPGQGAQRAGMLAGLYRDEPLIRSVVEDCLGQLDGPAADSLRAGLLGTGRSTVDPLRDTRLAQPALFVTEYAIARWLQSLGIAPTAMIGHSVGELAACAVARVLSVADALALAASRGALMAAQPPGGMLAVSASDAELRRHLGPKVSIGARNASDETVLSGTHASIEVWADRLRAAGLRTRMLETSHAFHSPDMAGCRADLVEMAQRLTHAAPETPIISSCDPDAWTEAGGPDPAYWGRHLVEPVDFQAALARLSTLPPGVIVEVGPGRTLTELAQRNGLDRSAWRHVAMQPDARQVDRQALALSAGLGQIWQAGGSVDWVQYRKDRGGRLKSLPGYPFARKRYWLDDPSVLADRAVAEVTRPLAPAAEADAEETAPARIKPTIDAVRALVARIVRVETARIPAEASFVALGIDSLHMAEIAHQIRTQFAVDVSVSDILERAPTLATLVSVIEAADAVAPPASDVPAKPTVTQLRRAQPAEIRKPDGERNRPLSSKAEAFLAEWIPRFNDRTSGSKEIAGRTRAAHADPRAGVGFSGLFKDLTYPIVAQSGQGSRFVDVDGNAYIDLAMGFGTLLFGHRPAFLTEALKAQLDGGFSLGPVNAIAGPVAEKIAALTGHNRVAFVNSGTDGVAVAIRLARAAHRRDGMAIFRNAYHGAADILLATDGWDQETATLPSSLGIPHSVVETVAVLDYGTDAALERIEAMADQLALVLVEPVQSREPGLQPKAFLKRLREITAERGIALVFDEVVTGFRCAPGGAAEHFGVTPDISVYGKVLGGGLPIGVVAGARRYLDAIDGGSWTYGDASRPEADRVAFAGTYNKNPMSMAAAAAILDRIEAQSPDLQHQIAAKGGRFATSLRAVIEALNAPMTIARFGSILRLQPEAEFAHPDLFLKVLAEQGVYVWEGATIFISAAHTDEDLTEASDSFARALRLLDDNDLLRTPAASAEALDPPDGFLPLSALQAALIQFGDLSPSAAASNGESLMLRLKTSGGTGRVRQAVDAMLARNPVLTARIGERDGQLGFVPQARTSIRVHDLTHLDGPQSEDEITRIAEDVARTPIDCRSGPLHKIDIFETSDAVTLAAVFHHVAIDARALAMVFDDFFDLYGAAAPDRIVRPIQADTDPQEPDPKVDEVFTAFWQHHLADAGHAATLPYDRTRPGIRFEYTGGRVDAVIAAAELTQLVATAHDRKTTLFEMLGGAMFALVAGVSGRDMVMIGSHVASERTADDLTGFAVDIVPVLLHVRKDTAFGDLPQQFRAALTDIRRVGVAGLDQTMAQAPKRPNGASVALRIVINQDPALKTPTALAEKTQVEFKAHPVVWCKWDLSVNFAMLDDQLRIEFKYAQDVFDASRIRAWLTRYVELLKTLVKEPTTPIGDLPSDAPASTAVDDDLTRRRAAFRKARRTQALDPELPLIIEPRAGEATDLIERMLAVDDVEAALRKHGAVLLRGFDVAGAEGFRDAVKAGYGDLFSLAEASSPRSDVIRGIQTSTDHPASQAIFLHNEQSYLNRFPLRLAFFCQQPAAQGGETPLASTRQITAAIPPAIRSRFEREGWQLVRTFRPGLGVPWQTAFGTDMRAEVEAYCDANDLSYEWTSDGLRTVQVRPAFEPHPDTGEMLWFNHAVFFHPSSMPEDTRTALAAALQGAPFPTEVYYGSGAPLEAETVATLQDLYRRFETVFEWRASDLLILDNMLTAHGRRPYSGERAVYVTMARQHVRSNRLVEA